MANPWHHAVSSARKWGGAPQDYLPIHQWFDETKAHHGDFRHRALRHHTEGIFLMESIFGPTISVLVSYTCESCGEKFKRGEDGLPMVTVTHACHEHGMSAVLTPTRKKIPTRWVGEQHVQEDLGCIPPATAWLKQIAIEPWMSRSRKLSVELEREEVDVPA